MKKFGLTFNNGDGTILVEADYFSVEDGFLGFYKDGAVYGGRYRFAIYEANTVLHCVEQKEYTEEEIPNEINQCAKGDC